MTQAVWLDQGICDGTGPCASFTFLTVENLVTVAFDFIPLLLLLVFHCKNYTAGDTDESIKSQSAHASISEPISALLRSQSISERSQRVKMPIARSSTSSIGYGYGYRSLSNKNSHDEQSPTLTRSRGLSPTQSDYGRRDSPQAIQTFEDGLRDYGRLKSSTETGKRD